MNTRPRMNDWKGASRLTVLGVALVLSGCATFANLTGLPDVTVCKHVTYERVGGVWKATLEECKA